MAYTRLSAFVCWAISACCLSGTASAELAMAGNAAKRDRPTSPYAIVIHGGAGTITRSNMSAERETAYRDALSGAVRAAHQILKGGGSSVDAVIAAITPLENSPLFNAGHGAVFTHNGRNELDASLMAGDTLAAGAVAGVSHIRNPIELARMVMERSPHVMLTGSGAEEFALTQGVALVPTDYFFTPRRWEQLQKAIAREQDNRADAAPYLGTVGAVALDRHGNLAAGTSTGGTTNKRWGRIGDSPVIGAGTYASNASCGVSATGTGEYFIRTAAARDVAALMQYKGLDVQQAADEVIHRRVGALGGDGGLIALDRQGNIAFSFNTSGMYRAYIGPDGGEYVGIYR